MNRKETKRVSKGLREALEEKGIPYVLHTDSTQEKISGRVTCRALGTEPGRVYKSALYLPDRGPWHYTSLLLVPADRKVDLSKAQAETGRRGRLVREREVRKQGWDLSTLGPTMSPYPLLLDRSASLHETIFVSTGRTGEFVEVSPEGLLQVSEGRFADLAGAYSDERYARDLPLLAGRQVGGYEVEGLMYRDSLGILYKARSPKGEPVLLWEFFPYWRCGLTARRAWDGAEVCYLSYVHDMSTTCQESREAERRGREAIGELTSRYHRRLEKPGCTLPVLDGFCDNHTFYTVMAWEEGEILQSRIYDGRKMGYEEATSSFAPLFFWLEGLSEDDLQRLSLRPASFFVRKRDGRALLLPLIPPVDLLGEGGTMQFHYHNDLEPFREVDHNGRATGLQAFYRVFTYALTGKVFYGCSLLDMPKEENLLVEVGVPREEARDLARLMNS